VKPFFQSYNLWGQVHKVVHIVNLGTEPPTNCESRQTRNYNLRSQVPKIQTFLKLDAHSQTICKSRYRNSKTFWRKLAKPHKNKARYSKTEHFVCCVQNRIKIFRLGKYISDILWSYVPKDLQLMKFRVQTPNTCEARFTNSYNMWNY
jgi:hypothetical protein